MPLQRFSPPGFLDELNERGKQAWSRELSELLRQQEKGDASIPNDSPRPQFFNTLDIELKPDAVPKTMKWGAFPRKLARLPAPERWRLAEERDRQEEYCEWSAERDRSGNILRVFFTTEVPWYYRLLAADDHERLVDIYREHVGEFVRPCELISGGNYKERNQWNLQFAMHMIQEANTLPAAATLVAQSTILREIDGKLLTNANDLIRCGVNADIDRNSDPLIVGEVNALARLGAAITLDDPVGLYLDSLLTNGWVAPDGSDPAEFWNITRGDSNHALRAVYSVPQERKFTVGDIKINDRPIMSPSQIAEFIQVKIAGVAHGFGKHLGEPRGCAGDGLEAVADGLEAVAGVGVEALGALPRVADLEAAARRSR